MASGWRFDNERFAALVKEHGPPEVAALHTHHTKETIVHYMKGRKVPPLLVF
jgi:hypothetical protein